MSILELRGRVKGLLADLNRDRQKQDRDEYDAAFPARYEVVRNLVLRLRAAEQERRGDPRTYIECRLPNRMAVNRFVDVVFGVGLDSPLKDSSPKPRRFHPAHFQSETFLPRGHRTKAGWSTMESRKVRFDAIPSHLVSQWSRSGLSELDVFHRSDTYVTPEKLLGFDWDQAAEPFLRNLRRRPGDGTAWLVLADWLEENNHQDRAEDIRR